jgi:hypothetical protein
MSTASMFRRGCDLTAGPDMDWILELCLLSFGLCLACGLMYVYHPCLSIFRLEACSRTWHSVDSFGVFSKDWKYDIFSIVMTCTIS